MLMAIEVIDLKDYFVMPGLIDMHVHIAGQTSPTRLSSALPKSLQHMPCMQCLTPNAQLWRVLPQLRDLGTAYSIAQSMRDAIKDGRIVGPAYIHRR